MWWHGDCNSVWLHNIMRRERLEHDMHDYALLSQWRRSPGSYHRVVFPILQRFLHGHHAGERKRSWSRGMDLLPKSFMFCDGRYSCDGLQGRLLF